MLNDQPTKIDLLGRRPFAESIARVIVTQADPAPQVIAIDGAWGDGKTTVFGFLSDALAEQGFKVVSFNPWRYKDEDSMLRGFALNLAETLGVHVLNKGEQWIEVAVGRGALVEETAGAAGFGSLGRLLHLSAKSLRQTVEQLLSKTRGLLNEHGQRVTVLVDDPDRLEAEQLLGLFRLIKLTADFDWLTFVLAMDCSAIIRTVGDRFGGPEEGKRFLEKIVQVPVRLPTVPHTKLREFALQQVDRVLSDLKVELSQDEAARFRGFFDPALMPLIRTPRAVKQYANVIRFSLGLLPNEVNPVDVMILEGVRLFKRELFDNISYRIIPKVDAHWLDDIMEDREDRSEKLMKSVLAGLDESDVKVWREALAMLFPSKLSRAAYSESDFLAWTDSRRVACDEYFVRYLAAVIPESDVPDSELTRWMDEANGGNDEALSLKIQDRINPKNEEVLVQKLRRIQRQLNDSQRSTFAVAVARLANRLTLRDIAHQSEVAFGQSAIFSAQCVGGIKRLDALEKAASEVIRSAASGIWAVEFFWSLRHKRERQGENDEEERFLPEETSKRLGTLLSEKLMDDVESADARPSMEMLRRAFLINERFGDLSRVRRWTKAELEKDGTFIRPLIGLMMQGGYSGSERHQEWPGDKEALRKVRAYTDSEWLAGSFSPEQPNVQKPWTSSISDEEAVFRLLSLLKQTGDGAAQSVQS
jgi:hypothetical protein